MRYIYSQETLDIPEGGMWESALAWALALADAHAEAIQTQKL